MQSPEYEYPPDPGPARLRSFSDESLLTMLETADGLTAAAIREVLYLRHYIHERDKARKRCPHCRP